MNFVKFWKNKLDQKRLDFEDDLDSGTRCGYNSHSWHIDLVG